MATDTEPAGADIVEIMSFGDLLDPGGAGFDPALAAAHRRALCMAPSTAAARAYVVWNNAYTSLQAAERRWLAQAVASDLESDSDTADLGGRRGC